MLEQLLNFGRKIIPKPIFNFFQPAYHWFLAMLANLFYGFPSKKLKIIGVTGTDGKTTTTIFIASILEEAGFKVGLINGLNFKIGDKIWPNNLDVTMAGRFQLQKLLSQMNKEKCDYVILEVTSEGIAQHRILGIDFMAAVLTNVSSEHLNIHKTFENYLRTKGKLFEKLSTQMNTEKNTDEHRKSISVVNIDDKNAGHFLKFPADEKWGYGVKNQKSKIKNQKLGIKNQELRVVEAERVELAKNSSSFMIHDSCFMIHLLGEYNIYNALAATTVALALGINPEQIKKGLEKIKEISGRMEEVKIINGPRVFIDFAHTPQGLEAVFKTAKRINPQGKLITVFGSAGGRDKIKRPLMGEAAAKIADFTILTTDDPRKEDPKEICRQIEKGFEKFNKIKNKDYQIIIDRKEAIALALKMAKKEDIIIIAGMGASQWMHLGEKKIPWSDKETALLIFEKQLEVNEA